MQGWATRYGLTWASAMVLVAAGIVNVFNAVIEVKERPAEPVAKAAADVEAPRLAQRIPVQRVGGALSVEVVDPWAGRPVEVQVSGCVQEPISLIRGGHSFPIKVHDLDPRAECTVQARRKDGRFWTRWTRPARASGAGELLVALPDQQAGGIGLVVESSPQGARIRSVEAWTPGWQAGLERGDIITAVDGWSLVGMRAEEMVERITGPEGSRAEIAVIDRRSGRTVYRTVTRRAMD